MSLIIRTFQFMLTTLLLVGASSCNSSSGTSAGGTTGSASGVTVLEYHNGPRRDGVYIDSSMTKSAAAGFHVDPSFNATLPGAVYAQLLYCKGSGSNGKDMIIAATEANTVVALDAATGATVWKRNLGAPVPKSSLPCGNIDPLGVTGTPVIDSASRTLFLDAMTTPDNGTTKKHLIFALSLNDGSILSGWPVDVSAAVHGFDSSVQNQRGALALVNGIVYVPYGGHYGDCGNYHGWLLGVKAAKPSSVQAWSTGAQGGGIWAPSGAASENGSLFIATGNTFGAASWAGGESLLRLSAGPVFSNQPADFFAPSNWQDLDNGDTDIGGTGPVVIDVPGSEPQRLLVGLGKDGKIYLVNRDNMGGIGNPVLSEVVVSGPIINGAAAYRTALGSYVVFKGNGNKCPAGQSGNLTAVRINPGNPPTVQTAWCADQHGSGSPMVTTTDGSANAIVWSVGAEGDNRLHGFDGDTGRVVYDGGGSGDVIGSIARYHTPILAGGRIFVAADGVVKAFVR